jgi:hypothetical protein
VDKKGVLGAVLGAGITLIFSLGSLLVLNNFSLERISPESNGPFGLLIVLMAPIAGGFLAGIIYQKNPRQAGLFAGIGASLVVFMAWMVISDFSWGGVLGGMVIGFVWIFISRLGGGFASHR